MDRKKNKNPRNRTKAVSEKDGGTQRFVQAAFRKPIKLDRLQFRIHKIDSHQKYCPCKQDKIAFDTGSD